MRKTAWSIGLIASLCGSAFGQTIGIQFTGDQYTKGGESLLKADDAAGLAGGTSRFFNAFNVDSDGNALLDKQLNETSLVADASGTKQETKAKLSTAGFTDVLLTGSINKSANDKLYKHALAVRSRGEAGTLKVTGLGDSGFGTYDVVVFVSREFFGGDPAVLATLSANGRTPVPVKVPHFATEREIEFADASVTGEAYDAKKLGSYVKLTGLSGDLTLTLDSALGGTVGIAGLQIIKTSAEAAPQPAAVKANFPAVRKAMPNEILVKSPGYASDVKGTTRITLDAPAYKLLRIYCWKQGPGFGTQSLVAQVNVADDGKAEFDFPADEYPRGPVTLRITGQRGDMSDDCYLQLYNTGGVSWNEGLPKDAPPAAKELKLVFADDFTGPLSIGAEPGKTYYDHLPPKGEHDFGAHPFRDFNSPANPFLQRDTYLRIRVSDITKSAGILSSVKPDWSGVKALPPSYFECRFIGPKAQGSWPAFWLLTVPDKNKIVDELDIIEAYGGDGPGQPNAKDSFRISPHAWNQGDVQKAVEAEAHKGVNNPIVMSRFGIPSAWYESPHTYGCYIGLDDTIYYVDNIEVARHPTYPVSKREPSYFLIDLATAGGWPVDLSRYGGEIEMYVDYVRVYSGAK